MHSNNFNLPLNGKDLRIAIIQARFNFEITESLKKGAIEGLLETGVSQNDISVFTVPGSFEISLAAKKAAQSGNFDAVICLGAIIKGDTPHFDYISQAVTAGITQATLETEIPIIFGVITVINLEQALDRSKPDKTNKGYEVAKATIEMIRACEEIDEI